MLTYVHKFNSAKNKYKEMLSSISHTDHVVITNDRSSFNKISNDRFEVLSINDLSPKSRFYEIDRSYQLRNIFIPILTFGFEDEFCRVMRLLSEIGLTKKFELKPRHFKELILSMDFKREHLPDINSHQRWDDPLTYITHKSACVSSSVSRNLSAYILRKDYDEYIHRESESEKALLHMKEIGLFEKQKTKYLKLLPRIPSSRHVIVSGYWPFFVKEETPYHLLIITELLKAENYPFLLRNIFVPIVILGLHSELGRVITLLKEVGIATKFELKPGYFKYLVKENDRDSNRFVDPLTFFKSGQASSFIFSNRVSITVPIKDFDEYFLRMKDAANSLWGINNYTCQYCGSIAEHIDHVMPLSKGGSCEHDNLVLACKRCNIKKHDNTPEDAKMPLIRNAPEIDKKWTISSEKYFKSNVICRKIVYLRPNVKKKYYEITLLDKLTGEIISEHIAETKSESFWKFIELYEGLNPDYTFNPFSRVDSAMRDGRDISLQTEGEELKAAIEPLKTKFKKYLKKPDQSLPVHDVYSALIQELAFSEKFDFNVFCCSICRHSGIPLADAAFYFYINSPQERFALLYTVICESCSKGFKETQKVKMGKYWADIVIGNKWHTLESFIKKRIGILRGSLGSFNYESVKSYPDLTTLNRLAEYIYLLDFCLSQDFKVSPWRPKNKINILDFVT
jgi:hypothetical protein